MYADARFLIVTGFVADLQGLPEDTRLAVAWTGY